MDDADGPLLARLREGDVGGLEELHARFAPRVHRLCRNLLGQDADAEDAVSEVFLKVLERASQFRGRSRLSTWLHRITVNHCLHLLERARTRATDVLPPESRDPLASGDPSPGELVSRRDQREHAERLLARLPDGQRAVLLLREVEGLSYREIAAVLEVPEGTVMSRLARARERIAGLIRESSLEVLP